MLLISLLLIYSAVQYSKRNKIHAPWFLFGRLLLLLFFTHANSRVRGRHEQRWLRFAVQQFFFFCAKKWKRARACVSRLPSPTLFSLPPHPFVGERGILFCYKCRERVTRTGRAQAGTGHPTWRESLAAVLRRRGEAGGRRGIAVIVCFCASFYLD